MQLGGRYEQPAVHPQIVGHLDVNPADLVAVAGPAAPDCLVIPGVRLMPVARSTWTGLRRPV